MLWRMGSQKMCRVVAGVVLTATTACVLAQTTSPATAKHHVVKKTAAPTTVEVINGTSVHTQTFSEGNRGGKVVGDGANIRVLNGTSWSTARFKPQPTGKGARTARGVTQVNVLNGTEAKTQTFKGGVPATHQNGPAKPGQPVVVGIESVDGKTAIPGSDASLSSRNVVVGVQSSESVRAVQPLVPKGRPKRAPYHPAQRKSRPVKTP